MGEIEGEGEGEVEVEALKVDLEWSISDGGGIPNRFRPHDDRTSSRPLYCPSASRLHIASPFQRSLTVETASTIPPESAYCHC